MSNAPLLAPVGDDVYRNACAQFATGVAVATAVSTETTPHGLTISSFTSVSIDPPLVLICIDYRSAAVGAFITGQYFAINVLSDAQRELSVIFAEKPEGRFDGVDWTPGATGAPLLAGAISHIECRREQVVEAGDHAVVFGLVVRAACHPGRPLLYYDRAYRTLL